MKFHERIGEIHKTNEGYEFEIIEYKSSVDVTIKLISNEHNYIRKARYGDIKRGEVKNPYHKSVYGIGYIGDGKYKTKINGKEDVKYKTWKSMLERCYCEKVRNKYPTYIDCTVCDEWHNFQNFAKWYEENYYEVDGERMCLDKDILVKGNKVYSPKTCVFAPNSINCCFIKSNSSRGNLPIGVCKNGNKYVSLLKGLKNVKSGYLGTFNTAEESFNIYKEEKENYIKEKAEEYKEKIPKKLYKAMCDYKVEIND